MFLGIDIGTSGTKAIIMDAAGKVAASASREYDLSTPQNGWAEQHPDLWISAAKEAIREVTAKIPNVKAVGLTGQMHGLVVLDADDNVIRPAILWCDQRTAKECEEITETIGYDRLIELTANPCLTGFTAPKIVWLRKNEPESYKKIAKIMLPKDYIRYKLTGAFASDVSDLSGTGLFDVSKRDWSFEVLDALKIDKKLLPKVCESAEISGHVTDASFGIPVGTPVAAGAGDNAAAAIGTGVCADGQAFVTVGTSGVLFAHTSTTTLDRRGRVHTFCAAVPGEWHVMGVTLSAGFSLKWLKNNFLSQYSYKELDILAEKVPIGADKLLFLPYLNGERTPHLDPNARGVFFGLSSAHGAGELTRAVMEGVSYSLRDCQEIIGEMGLDLSRVTACGGGGSSPFWRKMLADIFGCELNTVQTSDGPALGAAILGAVAAGEFESVKDACGKLIKSNESIFNDANNTLEYDKFYRQYTQVYTAVKSNFKQLAEV